MLSDDSSLRKPPRLVWMFTFLLAASLAVVPSARAEIPNQSQENLRASASHVLHGVVERIYEQKERRNDFEYTHYVAEIAVAQAEKGTEIAAGDRVFVRYWRKRWLAGGNPPPDHYGHRNVFEKSDSVEVYVKGDRKSGFDVLSPNGFFKVTKAKASETNP